MKIKETLRRFVNKLKDPRILNHKVLEYSVNVADRQVTVMNRLEVAPQNRRCVEKYMRGMLESRVGEEESGFFVNRQLLAKMRLIEFEYDSNYLYYTFLLYDFQKPFETIDFENIFKSRKVKIT